MLPPSLQQWSRPTAIEQAISAVTQEDKDCDKHRGAAIVGRKDLSVGEQGDRSHPGKIAILNSEFRILGGVFSIS